MNNIQFQKACEFDRATIANVFAQAFYKEWNALTKDIDVIANVIEPCLNLQHFIIAKIDDEIVGFFALVTKNERAITISMASFKKAFGFFKGAMIAGMLRSSFEKSHPVPEHTMHIDLLGVAKRYQRQGVGSAMLQYILKQKDAQRFTLYVTNVNEAGIACYHKMGFKEYERKKVSYAKQQGFEEYICMQYRIERL